MAKPQGRVLVMDGDAAVRRGLSRALSERGLAVLTAEDGAAGLSILRAQPADAAMIEAHPAGLEAAGALVEAFPLMAILLLAPPDRARDVVDAATELGADVLVKPVDPPALGALAAVRSIERRRAERELADIGARAAEQIPPELTGVSSEARAAVRIALEAARTPAPVLIVGEEGTGRETVARFVHDRSRRSARPFISAACPALASDPQGTRLFGSSGSSPREGLIELADRGTLFLDGIEALPASAQDRLISFLSRSERPAGGAVDVRIIAGTTADLRALVRDGTFRDELYFRLRVMDIELAPLRRRPDDVPLLSYAFLQAVRAEMGRDVRRISPEAMRLLRQQPWPGNAHELRSVLARSVALARSDVLLPRDLPFVRAVPAEPPEALFDEELVELPYMEARRRALTAFERRYTRLVLVAEQGNVSSAARRAGMDRSNFKRLLRRAKEPSR